jgi:hypothetical protein
MKEKEQIKMFKDVFAPKSGEKILFLIDKPHGKLKDSDIWKERRLMAQQWYKTFKDMGKDIGFSVDFLEYKATGMNNSPLPQTIIDAVSKYNLVIAITEYSATSSLVQICNAKDTITRCASMPGVEKRMEQSAFKADYSEVRRYANAIKDMLDKAIGASILFSTGDKLYIDLRNRAAGADEGDCSKTGQSINFPSGEAWKTPYEAIGEEIRDFGESKTEGIMPVSSENEILKFIIRNNQIVKIIGKEENVEEMRVFFLEDKTRRNIAELGIGCNPKAVVTGNVLEDEKVGGLHIAYGMSTHLGGKVKSDMHQDICYPKGLPVEATTLNLLNNDGSKIELIKNAQLRYELLK